MAEQKRLFMKRFVVGPWETNCYVVHPFGSSTGECWIIDAGFQPEEMIAWIRGKGLTPARIILTHGHADHIAGIPEMRGAFGGEIPVAIHRAEAEFLTNPTLNLSAMAGFDLQVGEADEFLEGGSDLEFEGLNFDILFTPGHSPGGVSFYEKEAGVVFAGDTLFAGSIGRFDFPTSDGPLLLKSIHEKLFTIPDATIVYPGHGPETTIGYEVHTNPFVGENAEASI